MHTAFHYHPPIVLNYSNTVEKDMKSQVIRPSIIQNQAFWTWWWWHPFIWNLLLKEVDTQVRPLPYQNLTANTEKKDNLKYTPPMHDPKGMSSSSLTLSLPETQIAEFANRVDLDEVAHNEPPHLDLHCLPSSLWILNMI